MDIDLWSALTGFHEAYLGIDSTGEHQVLLDWVKVDTPNWAGMFIVLENSSVIGAWIS